MHGNILRQILNTFQKSFCGKRLEQSISNIFQISDPMDFMSEYIVVLSLIIFTAKSVYHKTIWEYVFILICQYIDELFYSNLFY